MLAQLLRQNGVTNLTPAAPAGLKMELAKQLDAADTYVELSRSDPGAQFAQIKRDNPHGFDIVVEATGSVKILEDAINYCRRGGTLVVYGFVFPFLVSFSIRFWSPLDEGGAYLRHAKCFANGVVRHLAVCTPKRRGSAGRRPRSSGMSSVLSDRFPKSICSVRYFPFMIRVHVRQD
jgi:threonine dehydrogenase-like Zn-dependent dehydrogenase